LSKRDRRESSDLEANNRKKKKVFSVYELHLGIHQVFESLRRLSRYQFLQTNQDQKERKREHQSTPPDELIDAHLNELLRSRQVESHGDGKQTTKQAV